MSLTTLSATSGDSLIDMEASEASIPSSIFDTRTLADIHAEIRDMYRRFPQPWVIGYSGGKDSTTVLQLVWNAIAGLPLEERTKPVFVIASDTKVETPVIVDFIDTTLNLVGERAAELGMPFTTHKVLPTLSDSFWVNLIGRGYPAPTTRFRWCTDRMKILPANRFIEEKVTQYGEVIIILGVRKAESATRAQLMQTYEVKNHLLRRHSTLTGAYVYAPIADFSTQDIWDYLLNNASPWGGRNRDLVTLYRNASAGECPLVIDTSTSSCGNSRFGCWVCTVAQKDASMEALVEGGEEWLEPLLEFREFLASTGDPARKLEFRDIKGRDGRVIQKKDGTFAARTYKLAVSQQLLERLLNAQEKVRSSPGGDPHMVLIDDEELAEIRRIWRMERQDWDDALPAIVERATGRKLTFPADDDGSFDSRQKLLLGLKCEEYDVPVDLIARLLELERQNAGMARRSNMPDKIAAILSHEWRTESELLALNNAALANRGDQGNEFQLALSMI